jgi:hypothetical protein
MFIQFGKSNINHGYKARDKATAKANRRARAHAQGAAGINEIAARGPGFFRAIPLPEEPSLRNTGLQQMN